MVKPAPPQPDLDEGIKYWDNIPATVDGVLVTTGGYGEGSLPRIESLGSRQFLLSLLPELCTVPSTMRPLNAPPLTHRFRALDVGAGVGRVTTDVLLHLVHDVVLLEPVESFWMQSIIRCSGVESVAEGAKSVFHLRRPLQGFDPANIAITDASLVKASGPVPLDDNRFDVIWCQWCLGHLNDEDLVDFLKCCKAALRNSERSVIVIKENLCSEPNHGVARTVFDEQDSSLTRSDAAWKKIISTAGLRLIKQKVQEGLPHELYIVKM